MERFSFVAVDFETATNNRMICQVGIVIVKNREIINRVSMLVQPPNNEYDQSTINIHKITPDKTANEPAFDKVWSEIAQYFSGNTIVAHNADFDEDVLYKNLDYYGIMPMGIPPFKCTCRAFGFVGLKDLCAGFGMDSTGHHDATFDAECCAKFYLKHLDGERPNHEAINYSKQEKKRHSPFGEKVLKGDILVKDLSSADEKNPFYDRKVVITGEFDIERKELAKRIKSMGADIDSSVTRKTNYVLIGTDAGPKKLETIEKLIEDGYPIVKIMPNDLQEIFNGVYQPYMTEKQAGKDLDLTINHIRKNEINLMPSELNILSRKEIFFGKNFSGDRDLIMQMFGNLGASGDNTIFPETNICLLSDSTINCIEKKTKDETIQYIEQHYNTNKSISFNLKFITESAFLEYCHARCTSIGDEVTLELYEKYMESAFKALENKPKYEFKPGKNYCKVDGKIVLKLADGRTWCPSRQFRGDVYTVNEKEE